MSTIVLQSCSASKISNIRKSRLALLTLILGSLLVGIWADWASGRRPDVFDVRTAALFTLISWPAAEIGRDVIYKLRYKPLAIVIGILTVAIAHVLPTLFAGLIGLPRVGLSFLPGVLMGLAFTLEQALIPSLTVGSVAGVIVAVLRKVTPTLQV